MRRRRAGLAALAALGVLADAAHAVAQSTNTYALLSPSQPVPAPPPLGPGAQAPQTQTAAELRLPLNSKLSMHELVAVGVDGTGTPVQVVATQRLRLVGTGDYAFTIPAPATSAGPTPDSQSSPGLRDVGIVWQGFSDKQRILSARATLRTTAAAAALPLKLRIDGNTVHLENATQRTLPIVTSRTTLAALLGVLGKLRRAAGPKQIVGSSVYVPGTAGHGSSIMTSAPLRVTGRIAQGGTDTPVDAVLGGGRPLTSDIPLTGHGPPKLQVRVELFAPLKILPTAAQLRAAAAPLQALQVAIGSVAVSHAYRHYLASPDPAAPSDATYLYRTAARASASAAPAPKGGGDALTVVLILIAGAAALCGLAVVWARS